MNALFQIIQFASENVGNLLGTCGVFLIIGISLSIPFNALGPFVTITHNHFHDISTKEDNK